MNTSFSPSTAPAPNELPPAAHLWPITARVNASGRLFLGAVDVGALAREHGTPLYVYDEATIRAQCRAFREAFAARWPASVISYASKAYLSPALCAILNDEGLEFDAVSAGEIGVALAAGIPPHRVHLHGNFKPDAELAYALDCGAPQGEGERGVGAERRHDRPQWRSVEEARASVRV